MRKAFILTLCLAIVSAACICAAHSFFDEKHDQVVITENVLYGDRAAADGVAVELSTHYGYNLFWDTEYVVGDAAETETDYDFSAKKKYSFSDVEFRGVLVSTGFEFGLDTRKTDAQGIDKAYVELFEQAEPGQELETVIRLADYYEYYPLQVDIDLPDCPLHFSYSTYDRDDVDLGPQILHYDGSNTGYYEVFADYFKIPVLEEETVRISVRKGEDGSLRGSGGGWGSEDSDRFDMYPLGAIGKESCFLVFDAHSYEGDLVDLSCLPDGYGIFSVPYFTNEFGNTDIDPYGLDMVYELDPEHEISNFFISDDQSKLLLFTVENGMLMLTVIDAQTFETLQKLEVSSVESADYVYEYHMHDDFIVVSHGDSRLSVIAFENGSYEYQYTVKRYVEVGDAMYPGTYLKITADMDYDHSTDRLVISDSMENQYGGWNMTADFYISVYDEAGMIYHGAYSSSLTTIGAGRSGDYDYLVRNTDDEYITVRFN